MAKGPMSIMRGTVTYYDEVDRQPDHVVVGQFEYIKAQRDRKKSLAKAGVDGDVEYFTYLAFLAMKRQRLLEQSAEFETWMATVLAFEEDEEPESAVPCPNCGWVEGDENEQLGESPAPPA